MHEEHRSGGVTVDTSVPHSARLYNYFLGGKDNYEVDRKAAEQVLEVLPGARTVARANRDFMRRAARFLAADAGVEQFLDIGTGLPTWPNLHEVAQEFTPHARVMYTDNDPIVLAHARALLQSSPEGRTDYIQADLRRPQKILEAVREREVLDLRRPVALSLIAVVHFLPDPDDPHGIVRFLLDELPSGSWLALSHITCDFAPEETGAAIELYRREGIPAQARSREEIARMCAGLSVVEPGVVPVHRWQPEPGIGELLDDASVSCYGVLARKTRRGKTATRAPRNHPFGKDDDA